MDHVDHLALIRAGVEGAGPRWLELGAGGGAFTLALADVLGKGADILVSDRDARAMDGLETRVLTRFREAQIQTHIFDFTDAMPPGPFDGVLAANSLHFVADRRSVLAGIRQVLRPGGRLVIVEYDVDSGNPWVPHPFSFDTWRSEAAVAGFAQVELLHRVRSGFLGAIYGAVATSTRPAGGG